MAINQQHILREESYFDKMGDVSCGSYFIESLTDAIAEKALEKLKAFEKEGGYFACLTSGKIQSEVDAAAALSAKAFEDGKSVSIGINKFHNEKEQVQFDFEYLKMIQSVGLNNPALNYELTHYFSSKHA
jgi:methylmalonyl-CoA mutase